MNRVKSELRDIVGKGKAFDLIVCTAGGWAGGDASSEDFAASLDSMWKVNVQSAAFSAYAACHFLKPGGMITLVGAAAALGPTPGMVAYGVAKAATHHLLSSLSDKDGGLPADCSANALLPSVIDNAQNRAAMPDGDFSTWVKPEDIAIELRTWAEDSSLRPKHGSLVEMTTVKHKTEFTTLG